MNRLMVAGAGSGCGKTTVSCALLAAFKNLGKSVAAFKCGPDYIDPMFHKKAALAKSCNLDIFLMGEENVKYSLAYHGSAADLCLIEGVMGLYDGAGSGSFGSSNHLSIITETPCVLVADVRGKSRSVCAELYGYLNYEKNNISAVILNNSSEAMYPFYKEMIERELNVPVVGFMPNIPEANIGSRHLGLITADEIADIRDKIRVLAAHAAKHIDLDRLLEISSKAKPLEVKNDFLSAISPECRPKIYVADDEAFSFYYEDNHELFRALGAELCFFSPLRDEKLPDDADGIVLWGGYPELHAKRLADNLSMKKSIKRRIESGAPVYAECGGFVYLQEYLKNDEGGTYPMLGVLPGGSQMTERLQNFGYASLTANHDNLLCGKGERIPAHSFHYLRSDNEGSSFVAVKKGSGASYPCITACDNIFAGYPHIHFWGNIEFARRFVRACGEYQEMRKKNGLHI